VDLPYVAGEKKLNLEYENIKIKSFLPFAENEVKWIPTQSKESSQSSGKYHLFNDNFGEYLTLSLHPLSDFQNTMKLGPLNVHYMPKSLFECFTRQTDTGLIIWNGENQNCLSPHSHELRKVKRNKQNVVEVEFEQQFLKFTPETSPLPLNQGGELNPNSSYRIFSKKLFEKSPHLFIFGTKVSFFNKDNGKWEGSDLQASAMTELPWMGFKIKLLEFYDNSYPALRPQIVKPIQDNGKIIKGDLKALEVEIEGKTFWVTSNEPIAFTQNNERIIFDLRRKTIRLPFELNLDRFKMDVDPGTSTPASFESFVSLFKGNDGTSTHHIFMNHPLKFNQFTFYQASYFQTSSGPYGSVLSVNFDPGRPWKYLGCLILVLGSIWHYYLRRRPLKRPEVAHA